MAQLGQVPAAQGYPAGGSSAASRYTPVIYAKKLLVKFYLKTVFGEIANRDYEGEIKDIGDKVWIRTIPDVTVFDYYKGMDLTTKRQTPESNAVELDISHATAYSIAIDDIDKLQYDLKVTDLQSAEPRKYFGSTLLGCTTKKSDELQVKKLVPELVKFASENEIQVQTEKIPGFLAALGRIEGNVTIPEIEKTIEREKLYDDNYSREAFTNYAEQSSHLKDFDVEASKVVSKKNGEPRKVKYVIKDPELNGIVISGPIEAMQKIRTTNGEMVEIRIEIAESDLKIKYE